MTNSKAEQSDKSDSDDVQKLLAACTNGNSGTVSDILKRNNSTLKNESRKVALQLVCEYGHVEVVELLMKSVKQNDSPCREMVIPEDDSEKTCLHLTCRDGLDGVMMVLFQYLELRKDEVLKDLVLKQDWKKQTALYLACAYGHKHVVKLMLRYLKGKDDLLNKLTNLEDHMGRTVLHESCQQGNQQIVQYILDAITDESVLLKRDKWGKTPFLAAFENGNFFNVANILDKAMQFECFPNLILNGENLEEQPTVFHTACKQQNTSITCLKALIEMVRENPGDKKQPLIEKLLLAKDSSKKTFLFYISEADDEVLRILIDTAILVDQKNKSNNDEDDSDENDNRSQSVAYELLNGKDGDGRHVLQYAQASHSMSVLTAFLDPFNDKTKTLNLKCKKCSFYEKGTATLKQTDNTDNDYRYQKTNNLLTAMGENKCLDLIKHAYTRNYLEARWIKASIFFYYILICQIPLTVLLTTFVITHQYQPKNETMSNSDLVFIQSDGYERLVYPMMIIALFVCISEVMQMIAKKEHYWKPFPNLADLVGCFGSVGLSIASLAVEYNMWHHRLGTTLVCVTSVNTAWTLSQVHNVNRNKHLARIILSFTMMFRVIGRVLIFIPVLSIFILNFALVFHTLFPDQEPFSNIGYSMMTTIGMTIGELDLNDIFFSDDEDKRPAFYILSCFVLVVFLGILTISAMNLLVGAAVGDIQQLSNDSEVLAFRTLVDIILEHRAMSKLKHKLKIRHNKVGPSDGCRCPKVV